MPSTRTSTPRRSCLPLDVTSIEEIDVVFAKVKEHFGRLDVVVNNAGYGLVAEIEATPEDEAQRCFETCYWGPLHICQRVCFALCAQCPRC